MDIERGQQNRLFPGTTAVLNHDVADLQALGIEAKPTFYLNGLQLANVSFESLSLDIRAAVTAAP